MLTFIEFHPNSNYSLIMQSNNCLLIITLKLKKSMSKTSYNKGRKKNLAKDVPRPNSGLLEYYQLLVCCWKKSNPMVLFVLQGFKI